MRQKGGGAVNAKSNKLHRAVLRLSFLAECALCVPEGKRGVLLWLVAAALSAALFRALPEGKLKPRRPSGLMMLAAVLLGVYLAVGFFDRWSLVAPVQALFGRLGADLGAVMTVVSVLLLAASVPCLLWLGGQLGDAMRALEARHGGKWIVRALFALETVLLVYVLQVSSHQPLLPARTGYIVPSLLLMAGLLLLLSLPLGRLGRAMGVGSVLVTLWAVANHYVLLFHGGPLFLSELANTRTALNVMSGYSYLPDATVWKTLLLLLPALALAQSALRMEKAAQPKVRRGQVLARLGGFAACAAALAVLFVGSKYLISWSAAEGLHNYGYLPCAIDDVRRRASPFIEPDGYDAAAEPASGQAREDDVRPDVILILNETFCDLSQITDLREDTDGAYLRSFYDIPGAVYGHAVSPFVGGGTNNSEYELLTGRTSYLLTAPAPFNYLSFRPDGGSVVAHMKSLGYVTEAMHSGNAVNYSRVDAWPELGFDYIRLGERNYDDLGGYGARDQLDRYFYRQMYDDYASIGDQPRFLFLLTYQNHGGYEQNEDSLDRVHTLNDYGDLTDDVNEFLTSMESSARAFRALTEHFAMVDRPVIVCMVGDHAPSFVSGLPMDESLSELQQEVAKRTVPYVMWSNYGADLSRCPEYTSMFGLTPQLLRAAGLPLPDDYQTILAMNRVWPVFTSTGICMDKAGDVTLYNADDSRYDLIRRYLSIEYRTATEK
jgi:hypothetical protein